MPILWLFVRFLKKAGGFAGPPALQWVYSILAFCRGQGKRRAPAVQTLPEIVQYCSNYAKAKNIAVVLKIS